MGSGGRWEGGTNRYRIVCVRLGSENTRGERSMYDKMRPDDEMDARRPIICARRRCGKRWEKREERDPRERVKAKKKGGMEREVYSETRGVRKTWAGSRRGRYVYARYEICGWRYYRCMG